MLPYSVLFCLSFPLPHYDLLLHNGSFGSTSLRLQSPNTCSRLLYSLFERAEMVGVGNIYREEIIQVVTKNRALE